MQTSQTTTCHKSPDLKSPDQSPSGDMCRWASAQSGPRKTASAPRCVFGARCQFATSTAEVAGDFFSSSPSSLYTYNFIHLSLVNQSVIMAQEPVAVTYLDRVAVITLNRPEKLNAMTADLYYALGERLREIDQREDIFVTVLTGTGRFFSA